METKFTKGKWQVGEFAQKVWADNRKGCVASCSNEYHNDKYYIGFDLEEMHANALLISKAPEMYKRLENNILILQNTLSYFNNIRKYINACDVHKFKNNYKLIEDEKNKIEQLLKEATEL